MKVIRLFSCVDGCLMQEAQPPRQWSGKFGPIAIFTNLREAKGEKGPAWSVNLVLSDRKNAQSVEMALDRFLTIEEYDSSLAKPISRLVQTANE